MVRVLIADSSEYMRKSLTKILKKRLGISVIGEAKDGSDLIAKAKLLRPDVIVLDLQLGDYDGLTAINRIMRDRPVPIIVFTALAPKGSYLERECLHRGAVFVVQKNGGTISANVKKFEDELVFKIFEAAKKTVSRSDAGGEQSRQIKERPDSMPPSYKAVVVIAGPDATDSIRFLLSSIPQDIRAGILVCQHWHGKFHYGLAESIDAQAAIIVQDARSGEPVREGVAYFAPEGRHIAVDANKRIVCSSDHPIEGEKPNGDMLAHTVVGVFGANVVGVVLCGPGIDGKRAMAVIRGGGGRVIVEKGKFLSNSQMPNAVISSGNADFILSVEEMGEKITQLIGSE